MRVFVYLLVTALTFTHQVFGAEITFPNLYKGIGNTYAEETQTIFISAASMVAGSNFRFVSRNANDAQFSGNNVEGFLKYEDPLNTTITVFAIASRPEKSGGNFRAIYLYVADSTNGNAPTGEAYLMVLPGYSAVFPGTGEIGTSSDPVDNVLNSVLPPVSAGSIGNNQTICSGQAAAPFISVSNGSSTGGAISYQWELSTDNNNFTAINGATDNTYNPGILTTTSYFRRRVTDAGNNTAVSNTVTVTVTAPPATPAITAAGPTTFCAGGSVTLNATAGAASYAWFNNGTLINGATAASYTANQTGAYTVVVTNAGNCSSSPSSAVNVTVTATPATPAISAAGPTTFCTGGSVTLNATAGAASYAWFNNGTLINGATAASYTANQTGAYTVVVTNAGNCSSSPSAAVNVTVNALPATPAISAAGPTTFCAGGSVTLNATAGAASYAWFNNGTLINGATAASYTANQTGAYTVVVTNATNCSSAASAAVNVTVNALPATPAITAAGPTTFCAGGSVTLNATAGGASYRWFNNGTLINGATAASFTANQTGAYTVVITNATNCSSAASAAVNVTVNALPATPVITAAGATTFCSGGSVTLNATAGAASYTWFNNGTLINGATAASYTANQTGAYTVVVTNANNCSSAASAAVNVTVNVPPPAPGAISGIAETFPTRLNTYSVQPVAGATSYSWTLPAEWTGSSSTNSIQVKAGSTNGTISVVAIANGCSSPAASLSVRVGLFIADVITPNGDGFNDKWLIMRPSGYRIGVTIFNRWGQVVFKETDYQNTFNGNGMGSFLGKPLPSGTYYYLVDITDNNGSKQVQRGYLTLKRDN